ncbi:SIR2 family protein, partial [Methylophaga sp. UBA3996]
MTDLNLLVDRIREGRVVLFLGSGALVGATLPSNPIPLGNDLRDVLCSKFLNEKFRDSDLAHVSAMAISHASLIDVQDFIKDYLSGIQQAEFHNLLPSLRWRAIFTTNYDLLIEKCYEDHQSPVQKLNVIMSNEDNFDDTRTSNEKLPYLKLHGCVTRTHDQKLPLILTTDQYNDSFASRKRLFTHLYELAYENTIVFVGHSLQDHNIRFVMHMLEKESPHGQRHYLLKPGVEQIEREFWAEKKITALDLGFEDFLNQIESSIPDNERALSLIRPAKTHPIQSVFNSHVQPSEELIDFLEVQVQWITPQLSAAKANPKDFFKGINQGWSPILDDLAISRKLEDAIFEYALSLPEIGRQGAVDFFLVKGEAGAGKSVLLRKLATKAADSSLGIIFWVNDNASPDPYLIEELISKSAERVFLFWDDAAINAQAINRFITKADEKNLNVTLVSSERYNEWNTRCEELDELVTDKFELKYLSEEEIDSLVRKLEEHDSLGPNLRDKNHQQRCLEFKEIHGRQLLVALHEATMGEPFEDIIFNEYNNIYPESAKRIYLTVCTLNRLKVPVRAGLMSRIHEISFEDFNRRFYKPLEKVVIAKGGNVDDIHYYARHSEIAEIVFRRALSNNDDRYQEYIRIVNKLNISFSSDKSSFRSLIRAKSLIELFPDHEDVVSIYSQARASIGDEPYLLQQIANYERLRPNGSLDRAKDLLIEASEQAPYDQSILHSLSVVWRDKSYLTDDLELKKKFRLESRSYLETIAKKWGSTSYISSSYVELSISQLEDIINEESSTSYTIREAIRRVQHEITENKRQYPSDSHLLELEERFANLVNDNEAAFKALKKAFEESDREPYIAIRLSDSYVERKQPEGAKEVLQSALERKRSDHRLNYHYAELLRNHFPEDIDSLLYHYRRGFTPGDSNFQAQFWYARYAFFS